MSDFGLSLALRGEFRMERTEGLPVRKGELAPERREGPGERVLTGEARRIIFAGELGPCSRDKLSDEVADEVEDEVVDVTAVLEVAAVLVEATAAAAVVTVAVAGVAEVVFMDMILFSGRPCLIGWPPSPLPCSC